jgi:hypothetical protein
MRLSMLILLAVVLGLTFGVGITVMELGAAPAGNVADAFAANPGPIDPNGPKAVLEGSDEFDFGSMERESFKSHVFTIRNDGQKLLILEKGESSCRCTTFEVAKTHLQPGESAEVKIEWQARNWAPPQFRQSATVNTNDPANPQISFSIVGKVTSSHKVVPDSVVFTDAAVNQPHTAEVKIYSFRPGKLELVGAPEFSNSELADKMEVHAEPMSEEMLHEEADAQSGLLVTITVKPGLPLGPFRQKIDLRLNVDDNPVSTISVEGTVISDIVVVGGRYWDKDNDVIRFDTLNAREGASTKLFILASGPYRDQVKPKLKSVSPEFLKVTVGEPAAIEGSEQVRVPLSIEIPPDAPPGNHMGGKGGKLGEIVLETGHPEAATMKIPVRFAIESE